MVRMWTQVPAVRNQRSYPTPLGALPCLKLSYFRPGSTPIGETPRQKRSSPTTLAQTGGSTSRMDAVATALPHPNPPADAAKPRQMHEKPSEPPTTRGKPGQNRRIVPGFLLFWGQIHGYLLRLNGNS